MTLELTTPDPLFDPYKPVKINGYTFLPARRILAKAGSRAVPLEPMGGDDVTSSAGRANLTIYKTEGRSEPAPAPSEGE